MVDLKALKDKALERNKDLFQRHTVLVAFRGSVAHGTYIPNTEPDSTDDIDLMGIHLLPMDYYIGTKNIGKGTIESFVDEWDIVSYEFKKFIHLLTKSNPNVMSMLWMDEKYYIIRNVYGKLLIDNRDIFTSKKAFSAYTGYAAAQLNKMTSFAKEGYMGEKRKRLVEKFGFDCYDKNSTEFLTDSGWKKFDDVLSTDKLATVRTNSGIIEYQKYEATVEKNYTGLMYYIEPYCSKCFITENHNMLVSPARRSLKNSFSNRYEEELSDWKLIPVKEIIKGRRSHYHIRRAVYSDRGDYPVNDSYLELAGLFLSDGTSNFRAGKIKSIRVTQSKPNNGFYDLIRTLMNEYPIKEYPYNKEHVWVLHGEVAKSIYDEFGHGKDKRLPTWCFRLSTRQALVLFNSLMLGDGHKREKNRQVYYTTNKGLADDIHAMLTSTGVLSSMLGPYVSDTPFGKCACYQIYIPNSEKEHCLNFNRLLKSTVQKVDKEGYPIKEVYVKNNLVVCFEVQNGTLITRNEGKVSIQGNCKNASHCIRLLKQGIEYLNTGNIIVDRAGVDADELIAIKRGSLTLDEVKEYAEDLFAESKIAFAKSKLPEEPDYEKINKLVCNILYNHIYWEPYAQEE